MIVDSFEIDGDEVDIHIADNESDNCFSVFSKKQNGDSFNGFEFKINKINDVSLDSFIQSAPAFAIVSFMRRQIEENHWQAYRDSAESSLTHMKSNPREAGRRAFLNKQHYSENPYTGINTFTHDEWERGWAEEAQKNPDSFDFSIDSFQK